MKNPIFWVVSSIISGFLAIVFETILCKIEFLEFSITALISLFAYLCFALVALICGYKAIKILLQIKNILHLSGLAQVFILILCGLFSFSHLIVDINKGHDIGSNEQAHFLYLWQMRVEMKAYMSANRQFPDANEWSDLMCVKNFQIHTLSTYFAFNKNLSNASIEQVPGNTVLLLECEEGLNTYGEAELLTNTLKRDEYYLFPRQRFKYVLFVDGTIGKYRRSDGAISLYIGKFGTFDNKTYHEAYKSFGSFQKQGTTPYSPLKWK
jgi:hypothetical protein